MKKRKKGNGQELAPIIMLIAIMIGLIIALGLVLIFPIFDEEQIGCLEEIAEERCSPNEFTMLSLNPMKLKETGYFCRDIHAEETFTYFT